jgi:hypothetical protein
MSSAKVIIRPCNPTDKDIVLATWLRGQYWGSDYFLNMDQDLYFKRYGDYVKALICKPGTQIDCAVLADAPEVVIGYICYNDQTLYWSYTKRDYRKQGIFNILIKNMDFTEFSGHTRAGLAIGKKKGLEFNPIVRS